jgi:hypothetical protein
MLSSAPLQKRVAPPPMQEGSATTIADTGQRE